MNSFKHFLEKLFSPLDAQQQAEQAYLAKAVDACDLERRMHELEYSDGAALNFPVHAAHAGTHAWRSPW
ncbi:MAG TPA: DUF3563 family protein [Thiomonas arsenitoxydans]|jgi:hypothetical protein|uniref:Uncharacterized protein n=1 Tax=Thiomonas intermedia (strain K12) TaxID=75379 RepID=D5X2E0_THIK1|nr:DUF3563 family protein [Betaproteobacteria bacterium]MDE2464453.1 DUF3563 family protein [Alphaproteobacteria bacterium]HOI65353.1 DUF3563 family protein [Thiomonas arsenitoxydans]